ncbi:MAG: GNAT family N-acetyltransferase [Nanoarchaeales archaeon]|nr:GNAT family N-acetyltransferase [Nanoarchaeales archaeon]
MEDLIKFYEVLSDESLYSRFHTFGARNSISRFLNHMGDNTNGRTWLVMYDDQNIVGDSSYFIERDSANVAITIGDNYSGRGFGKQLFSELILTAKKENIKLFNLEILSSNQRMLNLLNHFGNPVLTSESNQIKYLDLDLN